jgi:hypothetical protein
MAKGPKSIITRCISQVLTLLLLLLYLAGSSNLEFIHSYFHDHDIAVAHSDDQENDPCHRLIYHHDIAQGCHHDSHLSASDKCQMCDLASHGSDYTLPELQEYRLENFLTKHFSFYKENLDSYSAVISSSRAPPVLA